MPSPTKSQTNLMEAHRQWAIRPADERFWDLNALHKASEKVRKSSVTASAPLAQMAFTAEPLLGTDGVGEDELYLVGKTRTKATLGHYAFGQFCTLLGAPSGYLRGLPAPLAANCLNYGIKRFINPNTPGGNPDRIFSLLARKPATDNPNAPLYVRAALSEKYQRIWNADIVERLKESLPDGWRTAPARPAGASDPLARRATKEDILPSSLAPKAGGLQVREGDLIAPAGLYASEKDMFIFMVNEKNPLPGQQGLGRGFFLTNSEVGDASFSLKAFLYNAVCGNHIVWDATNVVSRSIKHIGAARSKAWDLLRTDLQIYADASTQSFASTLKRAKATILGKDKEEVVEAVYARRISDLSVAAIEASYEAAVEHPEDHNCDPKSVWGFVQGASRYAQEIPYRDKRVLLEKNAGKLLETCAAN